jgi:hypothetical protein
MLFKAPTQVFFTLFTALGAALDELLTFFSYA